MFLKSLLICTSCLFTHPLSAFPPACYLFWRWKLGLVNRWFELEFWWDSVLVLVVLCACVCVLQKARTVRRPCSVRRNAPWSMPIRPFVMLKWTGHLNPSIKFSPTFCLKIVMATDDNLLRPIIFQVLQSTIF